MLLRGVESIENFFFVQKVGGLVVSIKIFLEFFKYLDFKFVEESFDYVFKRVGGSGDLNLIVVVIKF